MTNAVIKRVHSTPYFVRDSENLQLKIVTYRALISTVILDDMMTDLGVNKKTKKNKKKKRKKKQSQVEMPWLYLKI